MFRLSDCLLRETDLGFPPSPLRALVTMPCGGGPVFAVLALRSNGANDSSESEKNKLSQRRNYGFGTIRSATEGRK